MNKQEIITETKSVVSKRKSKKWLWVVVSGLAVVGIVSAIFLTPVKYSLMSFPSPSDPTGYENGKGWVDMGTSVKWATTNVGSSTPKGNGSYFAWGETSSKSEYTEENSRTYGKDMNSIAGNSAYDPASANWGSTWRLPTEAEFQELIDRCAWTWDGKGYVVKANNGNVLYLPVAGYRLGASLDEDGEFGIYWSASSHGPVYAWVFGFDSGSKYLGNGNRSYGISVRPVTE